MTGATALHLSEARWIWPKEYKGPNLYMQFRQEFIISEACIDSVLYISTDSSYAVWINGCFVHCAQFHDWATQKTYDKLDISAYLVKGENFINFLVYYQGENSAQYLKGEPGLVYSIKAGNQNIASGSGVLCRPAICYKTADIPRITPQLHFIFEYDGQLDDDWLSLRYVPDNSWQKITGSDTFTPIQVFIPRMVSCCLLKDRLPVKVIAQGFFRRTSNDGEPLSQMMYHDFLSTRLPGEIFERGWSDFGKDEPALIKKPLADDEGVYLILDLGREEVGLFELDIEANEGMLIDIAYGEHLDDLRVRSVIGNRNFANRCITKNGRQKFTHYFTRFAGRYLELHISNIQKMCKLYYAGLVSVEYPFNIAGNFQSDCAIQNKIYQTSMRTLQLCAHEHYEDCPWREQALYANDARNQALSGYYCFGEYRMAAASFELLGGSLRSDGFLELCAPAQLPITIPSFSMVWILAVADYLMYSGDIGRVQGLYIVAQTMLHSWLARLKDGLLPCPVGSEYWHFYDWASGLDGTVQNDCTKFEQITDLRYDAPLNLFLCLALESGAVLAKYCGNSQDTQIFHTQAETLKSKIHKGFFDAQFGFYKTYLADDNRKDHYAQLTQSLAVLVKACPKDCADFIRSALANKDSMLIETTLSQSLYKFEALLTDKHQFGTYVFKQIEDDWGHMLFEMATTFWETLKGGWDFDLAGSLCHGWSAIPIYFYSAHLLGILPSEPGFQKFTVNPCVTSIGHCGTIPTPHGNINVKINKNGEKNCCIVDFPASATPDDSIGVSGHSTSICLCPRYIN